MNMETMNAMKRGKDILKGIHGNLNIDKVEQEMEDIREQMELGSEISAAISNPVGMGHDVSSLLLLLMLTPVFGLFGVSMI